MRNFFSATNFLILSLFFCTSFAIAQEELTTEITDAENAAGTLDPAAEPPPSEQALPQDNVESTNQASDNLAAHLQNPMDQPAPPGAKYSLGVGEFETPEYLNSNKQKTCQCKFLPGTPYRDRRSTFGGTFAVQGGMYAPVNYQPDFVGKKYGTYYGTPPPLVEVALGLKFNFFLGSLTAQLTGGTQSVTGGDGGSLAVYPVTAGLLYALDNLWPEPYVVPYVTGGMYSTFYKETAADGGLSVQGNSAFAGFYAVGLMFQLDSLDNESHVYAYQDFGLENTFLYVEGRSFLASTSIPDLSTPLQIEGGLKFEF